MILNLYLSVSLIFFVISLCFCNEEFCYADSECSQNDVNPHHRYLLYDINGSEGFNLRRDVYMRFAVLAHKLKNSKYKSLANFKLVLPPWSHLMHWQESSKPEQLPWHTFFDVKSLQSFAPVIEMYDFFSAFNKTKQIVIDEVYILQHFEDMFETGNFEDRMKIDKCIRPNNLNYFYYQNITSKSIKCLSYHGSATKLTKLLRKSSAKIILLHHAEVALHEMFGDKVYWNARKSMQFNKKLVAIAKNFIEKYFKSEEDYTKPYDKQKWERSAKGGPYLSVHLRRRDFLIGRSKQVPTLDSVVGQIAKKLNELSLTKVFIATDATPEEYQHIKKQLKLLDFQTFRFKPSEATKNTYFDGEVAIIDQIICSYAKYFIGTYESTFSFRIQEEREILGFPIKTTFNCFCKDDNICPQPSVWKIVP